MHAEPLVTTHAGLADCTQHHSLLLEDTTPVTPAQVSLSQRLLQPPFPPLQAPPSMRPIADRREAKLMGSSTCYLSRRVLTAPTRVRLQPYKDLVEALYPQESWAVYQVVTGTTTTFAFVPMDSLSGGLLSDHSKERVPTGPCWAVQTCTRRSWRVCGTLTVRPSACTATAASPATVSWPR